jgi:hypothetical protein
VIDMRESEWRTELHAVLAADPAPLPALIIPVRQRRIAKKAHGAREPGTARGSTRSPSVTASKLKDLGIVRDEQVAGRELVRVSDAARYLGCAPGTLSNWITYKKFTKADGLRKMGRITRIHMPTLKARVADGTLTVIENTWPRKRGAGKSENGQD